jgi:hypothetical protein
MVETKLDQNQLPPSEPRRQIDYYKDVIRDVYDLIQPNSSSRTIPSPQLRNTPDVRFLSTPTDSLMQASPKFKGSPEVKQDTTAGQETLTENNDQDLASPKPQSSGSQPLVNCSPSPNTIAEVVSTKQQSFTEPLTTDELNIATSTSKYTSIRKPIQSSSKPDLSKADADPAEPSEVTVTPPHSKADANYLPGTSQAEYISQAPSLPNFNTMTPPIYREPSIGSPYSVAITATSMTGTQNAWTNVLDSDEKIFFCHFCGGLGFVYFGIETQRCAFCSYMELDLVLFPP